MKSNSLNSSSNATTAYFDAGSQAGSNPSSARQSSYASSSLVEHLPPRSATSTSSTRRASRQSIDSVGSRSNYGGALSSAGSLQRVSSLADTGGTSSSMGSVGPGPSRFSRSTTNTQARDLTLREHFYFENEASSAASRKSTATRDDYAQSAATRDAYSQLQAPSVAYSGSLQGLEEDVDRLSMRSSSIALSRSSTGIRDDDGFRVSRSSHPTGFLAQNLRPGQEEELGELFERHDDPLGTELLSRATATTSFRTLDRLDDHLLQGQYKGEPARSPLRQAEVTSDEPFSESVRDFSNLVAQRAYESGSTATKWDAALSGAFGAEVAREFARGGRTSNEKQDLLDDAFSQAASQASWSQAASRASSDSQRSSRTSRSLLKSVFKGRK